jgi:hypothetical protein
MSHLRPLFTWRSAIVESDLPPTARHVALTLALHMNERGGSCFPSQATLASETGLHPRTVKRSLQAGWSAGWSVAAWAEAPGVSMRGPFRPGGR